MKKNTTGLLAVLLFLALGQLGAQTLNLQIDPQVKYPASTVLSQEQRQEIIKTLETTLNEYASAATLLDLTKKKVTGESVRRFQELFIPTAEVIKDYLEVITEDPISYKDYASTVFNQLTQQGIQLRVTSITLTEVLNDASGYFIPVVRVEKQIFNYLDSKGAIKTSTSGRSSTQELRFDISKDNLGKARISKIRKVCKGKECLISAEFVKYAGFSLGVGWGLVNESKVSTWEQAHESSKLNVGSDIGLSLGYELLSNKISPSSSATKNLFFSVGARATFHLMKADLSNYSLSEFAAKTKDPKNNVAPGDYQRSASDITVAEKFNIGLLEVPIGLGFRLKSTERSAWFAQLRVIPGFVLFGKASGSGQGTYIASLPACNWNSNRENAYNTAASETDFDIFDAGPTPRPIDQSPKLKKGGFALAVQFSPTGYFDLSDGSKALAVGLDLTYNLRSFVGHKKGDKELFQYSDQYDAPIVQQYLSGMSIFSIGLRVGVSRKTSTRP